MADDVPADDEAKRRQRERHERQAEILEQFEETIQDLKFPVHSAEIAAEYHDAPNEVVGEEESLGSVLDRLDDEYNDPQTAREAILEELGEGKHTKPAETERKEIVETKQETTGVVDEIDDEE